MIICQSEEFNRKMSPPVEFSQYKFFRGGEVSPLQIGREDFLGAELYQDTGTDFVPIKIIP